MDVAPATSFIPQRNLSAQISQGDPYLGRHFDLPELLETQHCVQSESKLLPPIGQLGGYELGLFEIEF